MKKIFVLATMVTVMAFSASAQRPVDRIQAQRIERGFNSGQLTRPEKLRLQRDEFRYKNERRRALHDGKLNRRERRRLHKMRRHERREMFRLKHNGHRRMI
jgi:hypothetical protein